MSVILALCAVHSFGFALFHLSFWKLFRWREDLAGISIASRAILQIANLRLIYLFSGVGLLCLLYPNELQTSPLGRAFLLGMSLFWIGRLIEQMIFLRFNRPLIHALSFLFVVGAALFAWPLLVGT